MKILWRGNKYCFWSAYFNKKIILNVREIIGKEIQFCGINYRDGESMELYANIDVKEILIGSQNMNLIKPKKVIEWYREMNKELVSILMNCFNRELFLKRH